MVLYIEFFEEGEFWLFENVSKLRVEGEKVYLQESGCIEWVCDREDVKQIFADNKRAYISPVEAERQLTEFREKGKRELKEAEERAKQEKGQKTLKGFFKRFYKRR